MLDLVLGQVTIEAGFEELREVRQRPRVAIVAHWASTPLVTRSVRTLVRELHDADYGLVVVSAAESPEPLDWGGALPSGTVVVRKPNVGYDFGSWSVGLEIIGIGRAAAHLLLVNDSLVGPFARLGGLLTAFEGTSADVWGLTDTRQFTRHLQSYFLGFRGGILQERPLRDFFEDVRQEHSKTDIIHNNEVGLSRLLRGESYVTSVQFPADDVVGPGENPTIKGWDQLLMNGFPFVKREVVTNPDVAPRSERVPELVRAVYGVDVRDFL